jgi:two-component system response regulator AtoC
VLPVDVPPLRERPEDIAALARYFASCSGAANGRQNVEVKPAALELLVSQPWPGNVRQLENFVERLVVFSDGATLSRADVERELLRDSARNADVPGANLPENARADFADARRNAERDVILDALRRANNNRSLAARMLNMSRRTLYNKLEELELTKV